MKIKSYKYNVFASFFWVIFFCLHQSFVADAQNRFNTTANSLSIPDFDESKSTHLEIPINVFGLPKQANMSFGLETVQLAISHPYISDVKVVLYSPSGTEVWITNRNGRNGHDYIETRFNQNGFRGLISNAETPFIGDYVPDGQLSYFNNGQNPNGTWVLKVFDLKPRDVGMFNSASLFFGTKPAVGTASPCSFGSPGGCKCPNGKRKCQLLPDLVPNNLVTVKNIVEVAYDSTSNKGILSFAFETMNVGDGPLEMVGSGVWHCNSQEVNGSIECPNGEMSRQEMNQIIYGLRKGKLTSEKKSIGSIAYDRRPGHEHFHFDDYVIYELLEKKEGSEDISNWKVVGRGNKASFCIWDLGWCRDDLGNCQDLTGKTYRSETLINYGLGGRYRDCLSDLQGLSVGGTDLYGENYEGQSLDIPVGTCNGIYWLRIVIDPNNVIVESNDDNNSLLIPVELKKQFLCK